MKESFNDMQQSINCAEAMKSDGYIAQYLTTEGNLYNFVRAVFDAMEAQFSQGVTEFRPPAFARYVAHRRSWIQGAHAIAVLEGEETFGRVINPKYRGLIEHRMVEFCCDWWLAFQGVD